MRTTEVCCLTALEAASPRSKSWLDHTPSEGAREGSVSDLSPASGSSLTCHSLAPNFTQSSPQVHVCVQTFLNRILLGLTLMISS